MNLQVKSEKLNLLKDRVNLHQIPFGERGSRLPIIQSKGEMTFRLAECWSENENYNPVSGENPLIAVRERIQ